MDERDNINKYREKKKRHAMVFKATVFVLILLVILLIVMNIETIIAPFKDRWLDVGEGGFPVALPGSTQYSLGEMGENFYLLTDTYLYTYNGDGAEIAGIQHGFQNPECVSNDRRALVYDINGTSFKMYSRTGEVFKKSLEDSIVFGQIGSTDRCAIITTSTRYFNYLYVFNSEGNQIFRWASPDEKIMNICFGQGDNSIYASVIGEKNGELDCYLVKFELSGSASEAWRTPIGDKLTYSMELCDDGIYLVSSSGAYIINGDSGEIMLSNRFTKNIRGIPKANGIRSVIFRDSASNKDTIVVYDDKLETKSSINPEENITAFDTENGRLYILFGNVLTVFDSSLKEIKSYELDDEYSDLKIIGGFAYLFGYNSVQRAEL